MTALQDIHEAIKRTDTNDPIQVAQALVGKLPRDKQASWLIELVADEVRRQQRNAAHRVEMTAFSQMLVVEDESSREKVRALFRTTIKVGNEEVAWGKATIEQHEQRIAMLRKLRDGIDQTIDRHLEAITLIREAGVSCLDEIGTATEIKTAVAV